MPLSNAQIYYHDFPPTSAFKIIIAGLKNVTAKNYYDIITFKGSGLNIIADQKHKQINFTSIPTQINSITCAKNTHISAYSNVTHSFICST